jgi:hypothetical protein
MLSFTILPVLGLKDDVAANDLSMFKFITDSIAETHCPDSDYVGYDNVYTNKSRCANKVGGLATYASLDIAVTSGTTSVIAAFSYAFKGIPYHYVAIGNRDDELRIIEYTSGSSAVLLSDGAGVVDFICSSTLGVDYPYVGFFEAPDRVIVTGGVPGAATPFCITPGDGVAVSLDTTYYINFAVYFENRLFIANLDFSNGNGRFDIRYSNLNPTLPYYSASIDSTLSIPASNQLFYPDKEEITGIQKLNENRLIVYSKESISEIKYIANYASPFSIRKILTGYGSLCNNCIATVSGLHFFYDRNNGFCSFDGANIFPISNSIQDTVDSIVPVPLPAFLGGSFGEQFHMPVCHIPNTDEIAWSVSFNGTANTAILYYNYIKNNWRKDTIPARCIYPGYTYTLGTRKRMYVVNDTDIKYNYYSTSNNGAIYAAYRVEPILNFGGENRTLINEIWVRPAITTVGEEIDIWYRGGQTVREVTAASWTAYDTIRTDTAPSVPARTPLGLNTNNRYHQIKWGSDSTGALFSIEKIEFKYVMQGRY